MKVLKKSLSMLIVTCMIMSLMGVMSFAETDTAVTIDAGENVEAFEDVTGTDATPETPEEWAHGGYILRGGEWIRYSLPDGLKEGTYLLTAEIANYTDSCIKVIVNEGTDKEYEAAPDIVPATVNPETGGADGSMQFFTERTLGKVVLGGDNNTLTFKYGKWYAYVLKSFTLTYVSDAEVYEVHYKEPISYVHKNGDSAMSVNEYIASGTNILPEVMTIRPGSDNYYTLDVSYLPSGTYSVGIESASISDFKVDLYVGDTAETATTLRKEGFVIPASGGWNILAESGEIDDIYLTESMDYLKIDPVSTSGAVQIYAITFTKLNKDTFEVNAQHDCVDYSHAGSNSLFYTVTTKAPALLEQGVATMRYDASNYYTYDVMGIEKGTYKVYASYMSAQSFKFDLSVGADSENITTGIASDIVLPVNGTWTDDFYLMSDELCKVYIGNDVNYLKVTPKSGVTQLGKLVFVKVSDENLIDTVIAYNATISQVAGEGFYAKNGTTEYDTFEPAIATLSTSMTAVRPGNWYKYDISDVPAGKYTLIVNGASYLGNTEVDILINDELVLDNAAIYSSGVYNEIGTPEQVAAGIITIPELTEENTENILTLKGAVNAFNLKSIILSKNPAVNVLYERLASETYHKTLTEEVSAGNMHVDVYPGVAYEGKTTLCVFAVYKTNNETGAKQLYKVYTELASKDKISGTVEGIETEDGYTYTQKVFIWDYETLQGFSF